MFIFTLVLSISGECLHRRFGVVEGWDFKWLIFPWFLSASLRSFRYRWFCIGFLYASMIQTNAITKSGRWRRAVKAGYLLQDNGMENMRAQNSLWPRGLADYVIVLSWWCSDDAIMFFVVILWCFAYDRMSVSFWGYDDCIVIVMIRILFFMMSVGWFCDVCMMWCYVESTMIVLCFWGTCKMCIRCVYYVLFCFCSYLIIIVAWLYEEPRMVL